MRDNSNYWARHTTVINKKMESKKAIEFLMQQAAAGWVIEVKGNPNTGFTGRVKLPTSPI